MFDGHDKFQVVLLISGNGQLLQLVYFVGNCGVIVIPVITGKKARLAIGGLSIVDMDIVNIGNTG